MVSIEPLEPQLHLWTVAGGCAGMWAINAFHRQRANPKLEVWSDKGQLSAGL